MASVVSPISMRHIQREVRNIRMVRNLDKDEIWFTGEIRHMGQVFKVAILETSRTWYPFDLTRLRSERWEYEDS